MKYIFILTLMFFLVQGCGGEADKKIQNTKTTLYKKNIPKKLKDSFNTYAANWKVELNKRLKEGDATTLYDLQMHLQNIAILADERGDKEILKKLLELVSIPFKYLDSNKEWVDTKGSDSEENELYVSQYFALLTRVLDACERNGVSTKEFMPSKNIAVVSNHITKWADNLYIDEDKLSDTQLFIEMSAIEFNNYLKSRGIKNSYFNKWKKYVQKGFSVVKGSIETIPCNSHPEKVCYILGKDTNIDKEDNKYSGYTQEYLPKESDTDPMAMFDSQGIVKHSPKVATGAWDISHGRRFNWFFETVTRFGKRDFNLTFSKDFLNGWANNIAYNICQNGKNGAYFSIYIDGTKGWYRVNYEGREAYGYYPGENNDMNIHFVASSYGIFGVYNPKIYECMDSWVNENEDNRDKVFDTSYFILDYLSSKLIDLHK